MYEENSDQVEKIVMELLRIEKLLHIRKLLPLVLPQRAAKKKQHRLNFLVAMRREINYEKTPPPGGLCTPKQKKYDEAVIVGPKHRVRWPRWPRGG